MSGHGRRQSNNARHILSDKIAWPRGTIIDGNIRKISRNKITNGQLRQKHFTSQFLSLNHMFLNFLVLWTTLKFFDDFSGIWRITIWSLNATFILKIFWLIIHLAIVNTETKKQFSIQLCKLTAKINVACRTIGQPY